MAKYRDDVIIFDDRLPKKRKKKILDDLQELEDDISLPSIITDRIKPKENLEKKEVKEEVNVDDTWLDTISAFKAPSPKKKIKKQFEGFFRENANKGKKKKKGKKGEDALTDYHKEFDTELNALKNLFSDQSKFTATLQQKYDEMEGKKAVSRGIGKFTIDLMNTISDSRSTTLSILDKIISTKKTISELSIKEKEKFGKKNDNEFNNNAEFASAFLSKAIQTGRKNLNEANFDFDNNMVSDISVDDIGDVLAASLGETDRDPAAEAFLRYEGKGINVFVIMDSDGNWDFQAEDPDGNIVDDYPLPIKGKMTLNPDMHIAIDEYGQKYELREQ